jgi:tRNA (guanine-N7-)-methyltransferase
LVVDWQGVAEQGLNFAAVFGNSMPVYVDIGFGKGRVQVEQLLGPSFNYLGLEKRKKHVTFVAERLQRHGIENVRLISGYAEEVLPKFVSHSVSRYSILFPDPWPKRRQLKRRLVTAELLEELHRTLLKSGLVWVATDHQEYFSQIQEVFAACPLFHEEFTDLPPPQLTHFEIKYTLQQRPIYRAAYRPNEIAGTALK